MLLSERQKYRRLEHKFAQAGPWQIEGGRAKIQTKPSSLRHPAKTHNMEERV